MAGWGGGVLQAGGGYYKPVGGVGVLQAGEGWYGGVRDTMIPTRSRDTHQKA